MRSRAPGLLALFLVAAPLSSLAAPSAATPRRTASPAVEARTPSSAPLGGPGLAAIHPAPLAGEALDLLGERLTVLGLAADTRARLLAQAPAALEGDADALGALHDLLNAAELPSAHAAKARTVVETYLARQPLRLLGLELELPDRLFLGELVDQGVEIETAAGLLLEGRRNGWPTEPSERENLRASFAAALGERSALLEAALDAATLRDQAPALLSPRRQDELLRPIFGEQPDPTGRGEVVVCRACPYWTYGLYYPVDEWDTKSATLRPGECEVFRFVLQQGETYRFSLCQGGGRANFDSVLEGTDGLCHLAAFNDDSCGTASEIEYTAGVTGYFYLQVRDVAAAGGDYTLAWRRVAAPGGDPEATCTECPAWDTSLGYPATDWRTIDDRILSGGCRTYRFDVLGGHTYRFTTCEPDSGGLAAFDTVIESTNTSQACYDGPANDDACGTGSTIEFVARYSQYVTVTVRGFDTDEFGSFRLAYRDVTGECVDCANAYLPEITPDESRQIVTGLVPSGGGCDLIPVRVVSGYSYRFDLADGQAGAFSTFDANLELLDGGCNSIAPDSLSSGFGAEGTWTPCYTGLAYLRIQGDSASDFGDYSLAYTQACGWNPGCGGECLVQDGPHVPDLSPQTTSIYLPDDGCRVLSFDLEAGRTYVFRACGNPASLSPGQEVRMRMRRPGCDPCPGTVVGDCGGPPPRLEYTPTVTGTHYLVIEEIDGTAGPATILFRRLDDCTSPDTVEFLDPYDRGEYVDSLGMRMGARYVGFQGPPGRTFRFTICDQDSEGYPIGAGAPLRTALIQMTGVTNPCEPNFPNVLGNGGCPGELDLTFPPSGQIVLKVARLCGYSGPLPFSLRWVDVTPRFVFISSQRTNGDIGGISGAYFGCNILASDPGALPQVQQVFANSGEFIPWISDSTDNPSNFFPGLLTYGPADLTLPDGTLLWNNLAEIFIGGLPPASPIMLTETGAAPMPGAAAWTGTDRFGDPTGPHCLDWSDSTPFESGRVGRGGMTDFTWTDAVDRDCDLMRHVYCFEVED